MNRRKFIKRGIWVPMIFIPGLIRAQDVLPEFVKRQAWQKAHQSSGGTCPGSPSEQNTTLSSSRDFGLQNANFYAGQRLWTNAGVKNICRLDFTLSLSNGSITGKTFTARIWTMTGTTTLNANVASSTGVTGSNAWSTTSVRFDFASAFATTGGVNYSFTLDSGTPDGTNNAKMHFNATDTGLSGSFDRWSNVFVNQDGAGEECGLKIYYF